MAKWNAGSQLLRDKWQLPSLGALYASSGSRLLADLFSEHLCTMKGQNLWCTVDVSDEVVCLSAWHSWVDTSPRTIKIPTQTATVPSANHKKCITYFNSCGYHGCQCAQCAQRIAIYSSHCVRNGQGPYEGSRDSFD